MGDATNGRTSAHRASQSPRAARRTVSAGSGRNVRPGRAAAERPYPGTLRLRRPGRAHRGDRPRRALSRARRPVVPGARAAVGQRHAQRLRAASPVRP